MQQYCQFHSLPIQWYGVLLVQLNVVSGLQYLKNSQQWYSHHYKAPGQPDPQTVGVGLTVMVNVCGVPGQPFADGVTVIVWPLPVYLLY
jgi:hypothetical protein